MWKRAKLLLLVVACGGCGTEDDSEISSVPRTPCEQLRDHLIDLRMADVTGVDVEPHREAMKRAMGDSFLATCARDLQPSQIQCAIAAPDMSAAATCATTSAKGNR